VAAAGGELLGAAFHFLGELMADQPATAEPPTNWPPICATAGPVRRAGRTRPPTSDRHPARPRSVGKPLPIPSPPARRRPPLVYFKQVNRITPKSVHELHRRFWNHGGAPILVLVSDDRVHVYSGMTRPDAISPANGDLPSLVTVLDRVATKLQEFLIGVESGQFFREHQRYFNPAHRIDRDLLKNLQDTREQLDVATSKRIPAAVLDALLCRLVFTCYLFDREVIGASYLSGLGIEGATHLRDVLEIQPRDKAKAALYRLFGKLGDDFNGDLFSNDLASEAELVCDDHIRILADFFQGTSVRTGSDPSGPMTSGTCPSRQSAPSTRDF
jgi:hypothetical protein